MPIENIIYLAVVIAAFIYPLWMEDYITWRTWAFAAFAAVFAPIMLPIFLLNHKAAVGQRSLQRTRDNLTLERWSRGEE